jgi:hypothetical protein
MTIKMSEGLLREAFAVLRDHGSGRHECVVYLTGDLETKGIVDGLLHPEHTAFPDFYEVDQAWLHRTWLELAEAHREIRVQVHTHQEEAFHSPTDDQYPVVNVDGFLSLVVPQFATGHIGLDGACLARLNADGTWRNLNPEEEMIIL